ncbi:MAG: presqualene diphosphate synthase HpnD, partial [Alphaproteobacteria bacterium]|nr:presqualene diphosphate synthase HpnD [Alphaproteobacteria bacterium]
MDGVFPHVAATAEDVAHVDDVVRAAGTSFFWAMRLLPTERRRAMFAVYAFCREVDDLADAEAEAAVKTHALDAWRHEIAALYAGGPRRPTSRALIEPVRDYELERADFEAVIDGMAMDAAGPIVAPLDRDLELYCDRVAAAVGRLCVKIFGAGDDHGRDVAGHLGRAMQLTNILRDLDEDAALGRLYLPREALERHGVPANAPAAALAHPGLAPVCDELADRAFAAFDRARAAMAC